MRIKKTTTGIIMLLLVTCPLFSRETDWPEPRWGHSMVVIDTALYIFGGADSKTGLQKMFNSASYHNDLWHFWEFSFLQYESQYEEDAPSPRCGHAVDIRYQSNSMFLTGGRGAEGPVNDLYVFYPSGGSFGEGSFGEIHCNIPLEYAPRYSHTANVIGNHAYILGGTDEAGNGLSDFWQYGFFTGQWTPLEDFPSPISGHGSVVLDEDHLLVFCGGDPGSNTNYNDIYEYTISTNTWKKVGNTGDPMPGVRDISWAFDEPGKKVYMMGGVTDNGLQSALFQLDVSEVLSTGLIHNVRLSDFIVQYFVYCLQCRLAFLPLTVQKRSAGGESQGYLYLFGGMNEDSVATNQMLRYNIAGNQWAELTETGWQDIRTEIEENHDHPCQFILNQNYPNPFNGETRITYSLSRQGQVQLNIFDTKGRQIETLINDVQNAGEHICFYRADGLPGGIYFIRLQTDKEQWTRKAVLIK
ncbi:T9SS type A sorting domain-containing protein [bacterium]|nr:T9SS type A sorting domain-containing protein [bacterium]